MTIPISSSPSTTPAGSKIRVRIHGHRVTGAPEDLRLLQHLAGQSLSHLFREALEMGHARVTLGNVSFTLAKQVDHTFVLETGAHGHIVF